MAEELRLYSFQNFYLEGIHAGIQTAHSIAEMSLQTYEQKHKQYRDWALDHKTIVILNGGREKDLYDFMDFLESDDNTFIWDYFREGKDDLNEALTNVSIIIPDRIFNYKKNMPTRFTRPWYQLWTKTESPDYIRYVRKFNSFERDNKKTTFLLVFK